MITAPAGMGYEYPEESGLEARCIPDRASIGAGPQRNDAAEIAAMAAAKATGKATRAQP